MGVVTKRACAVLAACLVSWLFPIAIVTLGYKFGYDRLPSDDAYSPWTVRAVDGLFFANLAYSTLIVTLVWRWGPQWSWFAALAVLPELCLTAMAAFSCGLWVEGTYF
jgi:hypothetical protein